MSEEIDPNDPEYILKQNEIKRQKIIDALMPGGNAPDCNRTKRLLLEAITSSDTTALGRMRITADKGAADAQAQAAGIIASLLKDQSFRKIQPNQSGKDFGISDGQIPAHIPVPNVIAGELDTHPTIVDYETFTKNGGKSK